MAQVTGTGQVRARDRARALGGGAAVGLAERTESQLEEAVAEIAERGGKAVAIVCDVISDEHVDAAVAEPWRSRLARPARVHLDPSKDYQPLSS